MANLWPSTLPVTPLYDGYSESMPNGLLRTSMDTGPAKVRRRSAAIPWTMQVSFAMTKSQLDTFTDFVNDTLMGGSLRFEWTHPRLGYTIECRIAGGSELVNITILGKTCKYVVNMTIEVMP